MSGSTVSSTGGTTFEELCRGQEKNYAFNLVDLGKNLSMRKRIDLLIAKVHDTISSLEIGSEMSIEKFCIGKTYAEAKTHKEFKREDKDTWRLNGVSTRWHGKYKKEGYDGLVVLGAVSRAMLKKGRDKDVWNQQLYVLGLESALITHFAYEEYDQRLANDSLDPGKLQRKLAAGYVIYIAFKYEDEESESEENESEESETD